MIKFSSNDRVLVICCSDLAIHPKSINQLAPAEVHTHQNLCGHVETDTRLNQDLSSLSTLEYCISKDEVNHVIILTHSPCVCSHWFKNKYKKQDLNVDDIGPISLSNIRTFPWVQIKEDSGLLTLHTWHIDHHNNMLGQYEPKKKEYHYSDLQHVNITTVDDFAYASEYTS